MCNLFDGPCTQRAVRQALNYALNVPDLIKTVAGEAALPLTGPLTSLHLGFDPETPGYTYDPRRARDLLHQAGCGPTLGITLDVPTTLPDTELAKRMAESYSDIGIETPIIEHHDRPAYAERVRARQIHDAACFDSSPLSTFRVLRGALDELTACDLPEASVGSYPLVTRMRDGTRITVDEAFLTPLLQNAIDELEGEEVLASLLLCAGPFQALTSTRPLIRPFQLAAQTLKSLGLSRIGLVVPTDDQRDPARVPPASSPLSGRWRPGRPRCRWNTGSRSWRPIRPTFRPWCSITWATRSTPCGVFRPGCGFPCWTWGISPSRRSKPCFPRRCLRKYHDGR